VEGGFRQGPGVQSEEGASRRVQTTRKEITVLTRREAWLSVIQDTDGNEETELITIEAVGT
jgi:hypothetical protein